MAGRTRGALAHIWVGSLATAGLALVASGCDDGKVAHFGTVDASTGGSGGTPVGGDGGNGGTPVGGTPVGGTPIGGTPVGGNGGEPVGGRGGEPVGGSAGGAGGEPVGGGGAGGEPVGGAGGAGGAEPPPDGELPPFERVAITTAGDTTYVFWADAAGLQVRSFGADLTWTGPATVVTAAAPEGVSVAAYTVAEVPYLLWSTGADQPIQYLAAFDPAGVPGSLEVTGRPLVAQVQGQLLVAGRAPGGAADRGVAWQLVEPGIGFAQPIQVFEGPNLPPDSAGSLSDAAILRFGTTGQCLFIDGTGEAIGNFLCRDGDAGFISSDGLTTRLVYAHERFGDRLHQVLPLLGGGVHTPFVLGTEVGATLEYPFPADNGTRPIVLASRTAADEGKLAAFFPETGHLYKGVLHEDWPVDGTRALVRRGDQAVHVRFGYPDSPRLSLEPLTERVFEGTAYNFDPPPGIDPTCVPTLEDCDAADLDCDDRPSNGLCCGMDAIRWRRNITPPGPITNFAFDAAPNRDVYFVVVETDAGALRPYFVDFTDRNGNVSAEAAFITDMQTTPKMNEPPYDLTGATGLIGYLSVSSWRATLAHGPLGDIRVFWNAPSTGAVAQNTREFSTVDGCDQVLAYDRVVGDPAQAGQIAAIVVCPDRIVRLPPRFSDGETVTVPITAPGDIPVRAEWATTMRFGNELVIIVVAYRTEAGDLAFLRYQAAPTPGPGAPSGIAPQAVGGGALASIPSDDRGAPIYWSVSNAAYVQLTAPNAARALVADGQGWVWSNAVSAPTVERYEMADLNNQLIGGGPLGDGRSWGFWTLSLSGDGGTNLWAPTPAVVLQDVPSALWHTTRGASNNDDPGAFNGKRYPGVMALYPDPENAGQWTIDLSGADCAAP